MAQTQRTRRVADLLQRELALILQRDLTDPRLGFLTVTEVDASPDLRQAKVYVTCLSRAAEQTMLDKKTQQAQIHILQGSVGFIRRLLKDKVQLRILPRLHFVYDETGDKAYRIAQRLSESASVLHI